VESVLPIVFLLIHTKSVVKSKTNQRGMHYAANLLT